MKSPINWNDEIAKAWTEGEAEKQDLSLLRSRLNRAVAPWLRPTRFRAVGRAPESWSDRDLILGAAAGSEEAWRIILDRYLGKLKTKARRSVPEDVAEDMASDALLAFVKGAPGYGEPFRLGPLLYRILRNTILTYLRSESHRRHDPLLDPIDEGKLEALENLVRSEERARVVAAIDQHLDLRLETVVIGRLMDRSYEEIADELGLTPEYARRLHSRALEKLREKLGDKP